MRESVATPFVSEERPRWRADVRILGVRFDRLTRGEVVRELERSFGRKEAWKVYIVNAHTLNVACGDAKYRETLNEARLVLNDGSGVQISSRFAGRPFPDNLVGTDLIPDLCVCARRKGVGVFLLGGEAGVAEVAGRRLQEMVPGIRICGTHHGYIGDEEAGNVIELVNRSGAGVLLVAFGNPLQENWIHRHAPLLRCDVCIGVGGLFDHLSGRLKRAPVWMRRFGIEWVHILISQPHKWRRYIIGNPLFVSRTVTEWLRRKGG